MRSPIHTRPKAATLFTLAIVVCLYAVRSFAGGGELLHVLLTNDDGFDAPGIKAMHTALLDAGYRVSVVAPENQQSGTSMRVSLGQLKVQKTADAFWTISGSPADSVAVALKRLLREDPPDIVVSGINFGENLGSNTNLSGTVGAAMMAAQLGKPALAVSVGLRLAERDAKPHRFPSTMRAFPDAATMTVRLLHALENRSANSNERLMPQHTILNLNYPARSAAEINGVRVAAVSRDGGFVTQVGEPDSTGKIDITLHHGPVTGAANSNTDTELFHRGFVTLSALDSYLGAKSPTWAPQLSVIADALNDTE